jgi:hypothetical protein
VKVSLLSLDAASYRNHALHRGERAWLETNCYVDLWIEVLAAYGFDPQACLAFTVSSDFEGDQWLFFKPPAGELDELYGVDVQELNIWRPLLDHVFEQLGRGRLVLVEVDAFHLPDTAGVSYRTTHTKTTIGIESLDRDARTLGYFHNAGYFALGPEDFGALFGLDGAPQALVPYTEFARIDRERALTGEALVARSRALLQKHIARSPRDNPIARFRQRFTSDLGWLSGQPQETFHLYAFATLRQCGACYELAGGYLRWLAQQNAGGLLRKDASALVSAAEAFENLSSHTKTVQFKAARAVVLHRPVDFAPLFQDMEQAWQTAMQCLQSLTRS